MFQMQIFQNNLQNCKDYVFCDNTGFFKNMYFRSVILLESHFLLTAKKQCLLLCNLPYVVIYLVNMKTIA